MFGVYRLGVLYELQLYISIGLYCVNAYVWC